MANNNNQGVVMREYRKGNWTVQETMVLIEAKKMDDERRMKRQGGETSEGGGRSNNKPAELRWKWVEDYCWRNGCLRSQNQCNDKWDNLMRDFKKVRDYERRKTLLLGAEKETRELGGEQNIHHQQGLLLSSSSPSSSSYWKMESNERKEKNLPSNMLPQIYEALAEVVERKTTGQRVVAGGSARERPTSSNVIQPPSSSSHLPPLVQHPISAPIMPLVRLPPPPLSLPPPPPSLPAAQPPSPYPYYQTLPTMFGSSDSDTSEYSDSPAKRRRRGGGGGEGTSGTASGGVGHGNSHEVGSAISRSASIIADAIQACEEREERRHRELMSMQERRLQIEESKAEINRQGINNLVDAINKLADSVFALASNNQASPK